MRTTDLNFKGNHVLYVSKNCTHVSLTEKWSNCAFYIKTLTSPCCCWGDPAGEESDPEELYPEEDEPGELVG